MNGMLTTTMELSAVKDNNTITTRKTGVAENNFLVFALSTLYRTAAMLNSGNAETSTPPTVTGTIPAAAIARRIRSDILGPEPTVCPHATTQLYAAAESRPRQQNP